MAAPQHPAAAPLHGCSHSLTISAHRLTGRSAQHPRGTRSHILGHFGCHSWWWVVARVRPSCPLAPGTAPWQRTVRPQHLIAEDEDLCELQVMSVLCAHLPRLAPSSAREQPTSSQWAGERPEGLRGHPALQPSTAATPAPPSSLDPKVTSHHRPSLCFSQTSNNPSSPPHSVRCHLLQEATLICLFNICRPLNLPAFFLPGTGSW